MKPKCNKYRGNKVDNIDCNTKCQSARFVLKL